jgi:dihydroorotate dehydrogenase electron transfer subunit
LQLEVASVISNREVMPEAYLIWLEAPQIASAACPGQFVMVHCGKETLLRRPLSVHQVDGDKLAFLYAVVGKGTHWLSQRQAGDRIDLLGPLGNGFSINPASKNVLLVAGGIGIAPLYFLVQEAVRRKCAVKLLYGTVNRDRYPLSPEIEVVAATEDGSVGTKGMVTDLLPKYVDWAGQVFACGPVSMYRDMAARNQQFLKGKPAQISLEVTMGCGLGVCYGCTVKTKNGLKQVCQDGPVFELEDILWDELGMKEV